MKNQNNNRKKTHTTYSITNTHTHQHRYIHTENRNERDNLLFEAVFCVQTWMEPAFHHWFPQNGAWTALKRPPNVLKTRTNLPFTPGFSQKGAWTAPKPPPTKKKKHPKKKRIPKTIPHPFQTHILFLNRLDSLLQDT